MTGSPHAPSAEERAQADAAREALRRAYQTTWENPSGRAVLQDLMEFSGINRDGLTAAETLDGSLDPLKLAAFGGTRRLGLRITSFLDLAPHQIGARHASPLTPPQQKAKTGP